MSSLRNAVKSSARSYKERSQLTKRKHLGLLEKHKDYVLRARDYHRKQAHLKRLRIKAKEKNPDEFYFKMISQKTQEGIHIIQNSKRYTQDEVKLMKTQDLNYINMKKNIESKKIEKLQSNLHFVDTAGVPNRQHIIFVDSQEEANEDQVTRSKQENKETSNQDNRLSQKIDKLRQRSYAELNQRKERERQLEAARQQLELTKHLMGSGKVNKHKGSVEDDGRVTKPVFRWRQERKK